MKKLDKEFIFFLLLTILALLFFPTDRVCSYEKTHGYITMQAFHVWPNDGNHEIYEFLTPLPLSDLLLDHKPLNDEENGEYILEGVVEEDFGDRGEIIIPLTDGNYIKIQLKNWMDHSWNPDNDNVWQYTEALLDPMTAVSKGCWAFLEACDQYSSGDKEKAYWYLGRAVHCLQDMSVPAHVHCDIHIILDSYESWTKEIENYTKWNASNVNSILNLDNDLLLSPPGNILPHNVEKLFYNLAQATQSFPSNNAKRDTNSVPPFADGWGSVFGETTINWYDPNLNSKMEAIAEKMIPLAIQYTATLYYLFWEAVSPKAIFDASPDQGFPALRVDFDASESKSAMFSNILEYNWAFGDGTTDNGSTSSHVYNNPGIYRVSLTIKDENGNIDTCTKTIKVDNTINVSFTASPDNAPINTQITFTPNSNDANGAITSYRWNFGDGSPEIEETLGEPVTHSYTNNGSYVVRLIAYGPSGQNEFDMYVNIGSGGPTYISYPSYSYNHKWTKYWSPYVITGTLTINNGCTLTIDPGVVVKFATEAIIIVKGQLLADGLPNDKIVFTSLKDDNHGGDTNNDGNATSPSTGDWRGILFTETSVNSLINHSVIKYGGRWNQSCIGISSCSPTITNSEIAYNSWDGMHASSSKAIITGNNIHHNGYYGISLISSNATVLDNTITNNYAGVTILSSSRPVIKSNSFIGNNGYAIRMTPDCSPEFVNNTASGNTYNGIGVDKGDMTANTIWYNNLPYIIGASDGYAWYMNVNQGCTLIINPGTVVKFANAESSLNIKGTLIANGTSSNKIVFTSIKDDNHGGDTNNDNDNTSPSAGNWMGISFSETSINSVINNTIIRYGGGSRHSGSCNIGISSSSPTIINSEIAYSGNSGIITISSKAIITGNNIHHNVYGIETWSGGISVLNSIIRDNSTGMLLRGSSDETVKNCLITDNSVYGILCYPSNTIISNCTISKNSANGGTGSAGISCQNGSLPRVINTILWDNQTEIYVGGYIGGSSIDITYSNIEGGWDGDGNINADPMFMDITNANYRLSDYSPCIGAGTADDVPDKDIEGSPRPAPSGSNPDIGAYENKLDKPKTSKEDLIIQVLCPVDLAITDPNGKTITKSTSEIPLGSYMEIDLNGDGDMDDLITILNPIAGQYYIQVIPEQDAPPNDTYTLQVLFGDKILTIADNELIENIPIDGYTFDYENNIATTDISLKTGWNLISCPIQPNDNSVDKVLESIAGKYNSIFAYNTQNNSWQYYIITGGTPIINDLTTIDPNKGYWINMTEDIKLTVTGTSPADLTIPLLSGWNLVGYKGTDGKSRIDAISSIYQQCMSMFAYDTQANSWQYYINAGGSQIVNDLDRMYQGKGYWISASSDCVWGSNASSLAAPMAFDSAKQTTPRPELPYIVYGNVEVDGVKVKKGVSYTPSVMLKVDGKTLSTYRMFSDKGYGEYYTFEIPITDDSGKLEIYVEMDGNISKVGELPIGLPGKVTKYDLSYKRTPKESRLLQNYPNPFNPETWIPYQLSETSKVAISIYNINGRLVRKLDLGRKEAGIYTDKERAAYWDGRNEEGEQVSSGIYFYQIQSGKFSRMMKSVMLK